MNKSCSVTNSDCNNYYAKGLCSFHYHRQLLKKPLEVSQFEQRSRAHKTHGATRSPEYRIWQQIKLRCNNPRNKAYHNYGGRGIKVCDEWRDSYEAFYAHVGARPNAKLTLDRIDNNGNYEPGNVRWATRTEQMLNTRNTTETPNVYYMKGAGHARRWRVELKRDSTLMFYGIYKTKGEAIEARDKAIKEYERVRR